MDKETFKVEWKEETIMFKLNIFVVIVLAILFLVACEQKEVSIVKPEPLSLEAKCMKMAYYSARYRRTRYENMVMHMKVVFFGTIRR